jgi:hypothetical protein
MALLASSGLILYGGTAGRAWLARRGRERSFVGRGQYRVRSVGDRVGGECRSSRGRFTETEGGSYEHPTTVPLARSLGLAVLIGTSSPGRRKALPSTSSSSRSASPLVGLLARRCSSSRRRRSRRALGAGGGLAVAGQHRPDRSSSSARRPTRRRPLAASDHYPLRDALWKRRVDRAARARLRLPESAGVLSSPAGHRQQACFALAQGSMASSARLPTIIGHTIYGVCFSSAVPLLSRLESQEYQWHLASLLGRQSSCGGPTGRPTDRRSSRRGSASLAAPGHPPTSRLGGHLELLRAQPPAPAGRELDIITQAETISSFIGPRNDLWRATCVLRRRAGRSADGRSEPGPPSSRLPVKALTTSRSARPELRSASSAALRRARLPTRALPLRSLRGVGRANSSVERGRGPLPELRAVEPSARGPTTNAFAAPPLPVWRLRPPRPQRRQPAPPSWRAFSRATRNTSSSGNTVGRASDGAASKNAEGVDGLTFHRPGLYRPPDVLTT